MDEEVALTIYQLSEGNPGAVVICAEMVKRFGFEETVEALVSNMIWGSDIAKLKDVCNGDIEVVFQSLNDKSARTKIREFKVSRGV